MEIDLKFVQSDFNLRAIKGEITTIYNSIERER